VIQPLIEPLYPSKSAHELLAALQGDFISSGYDIIRSAWAYRLGEAEFEKKWRKILHDGLGPKIALAGHPKMRTPASSVTTPPAPAPDSSLDLLIRPDPYLLDGRFAENIWLQELPKPLTKLTWGNAAHLSTSTAARLGLSHGDVAELRFRGRVVQAPVWLQAGHADDCVTIHLGHGRTRAGEFGSGSGFNAFALQTSDAPWGGSGLEIRKTSQRHVFATTQQHQQMEGRDPVQVTALDRMAQFASAQTLPGNESLYPKVEYGSPSWGMVIDLNCCTGCAACTIACQAENNIPVVGREQVLRGREMHWIRVDTYYAESPAKAQILHQPVPCMHCENAPCEAVCPVAATVHDSEGLNVMVYNRCIGTRYCSNNCPYKVRRFNFLDYHGASAPQTKLQQNPQVSVRMRGVMEKCTYCVQRISAARIAAEKESRSIRDGEVVPACAQACPADAIVFGDIQDPQSRVARLRMSPRHYTLLAELNTRPRTTYLARVTNLNPELANA
jgi:Fe-S-cluster-containing dehydrogenase component